MPRIYTKHNKEFWQEGGKQAAVLNHRRKMLAYTTAQPPSNSEACLVQPQSTTPNDQELTEGNLKTKTVKFLTETLVSLTGSAVRKKRKSELISDILKIKEKQSRLE